MARPTIVDPRFGRVLRQLMTRRDLSIRALAAITYLGHSTIGGYLTGDHAPDPATARRLDEVLQAGGALAGLVSDRLAYIAHRPRSLDRAAVDDLAAELARLRTAEDQLGAAPMIPTAAARLDLLAELAREARAPVRDRLVWVGAQWAQWSGWLAVATGRWGRAATWLDRALCWAAEAGDPDLLATVLSWRGYRALLRDELGPAISLTRAALRHPQVCVDGRAYDHHQLARVLALAGERHETAEVLAAGMDLAAAALAAESRPPWHYYRTASFWRLEEGLVRSQLGQRDRAEELVRAGLAGLPPETADADWTGQYRAVLSEVSGSDS